MKSEAIIYKLIPYIFMTLLITFLLSTAIIGGDAMSGKVDNSKYFVWDNIKKRDVNGGKLYIEVSKWVYMLNLTNMYLAFAMMPIFIAFKVREFFISKKRQ